MVNRTRILLPRPYGVDVIVQYGVIVQNDNPMNVVWHDDIIIQLDKTKTLRQPDPFILRNITGVVNLHLTSGDLHE